MEFRHPRWARSVRRRPAAFLALIVLTGTAVLIAMLTPLLLRSVQQVALQSSIRAAVPPRDAVVGLASVGTDGDLALPAAALTAIEAPLRDRAIWEPAERTVASTPAVPWSDQGRRSGRVAVALDGCAQLGLVSGWCPDDAEEALVARAASDAVRRSSRIVLGDAGSTRTLRVVGVYDDRTTAGRLTADPEAVVGGPASKPGTTIVVGPRDLARLGLTVQAQTVVVLRPTIRLDDVPVVRRGVSNAQRAVLGRAGAATDATTDTDLAGLLSSSGRAQAAALTLVAAPAVEALVLAWYALGHLMQRLAQARSSEWGIGRTRGARRSVWLRQVFLEPAVALLIGSILGLVAAGPSPSSWRGAFWARPPRSTPSAHRSSCRRRSPSSARSERSSARASGALGCRSAP